MIVPRREYVLVPLQTCLCFEGEPLGRGGLEIYVAQKSGFRGSFRENKMEL